MDRILPNKYSEINQTLHISDNIATRSWDLLSNQYSAHNRYSHLLIVLEKQISDFLQNKQNVRNLSKKYHGLYIKGLK